MAFALGIDVGTSRVKAVLVNKKTEEVFEESFQSLNSEHLKAETPTAKERKVEDIFQALGSCMKDLENTNMLGHVDCIGICGQMHGCVLWNNDFDLDLEHLISLDQGGDLPCSNFITWQDGRCSSDFIVSLPSSESVPPISTGYGCATLFWLQRHRPELLARFSRAGTIMDLLVWGLCRTKTPPLGMCSSCPVTMSSQNAFSWGYFNSSKGEWEKELLMKSDFPVHLLPEVVDAPYLAGSLQKAWHGIPCGTAVGVAMGDLQCSIRATKPSYADAILNMGSASQLAVIHRVTSPNHLSDIQSSLLPVPSLPRSVMQVPYFQGDALLVAASLTGGNGFSKLVELLESWLGDLSIVPPDRESLYDRLIALAEENLDTDLKVSTSLWGERHRPELTGSAANLRPDNLSLGSVSAAVMRGIVENLSDMMPEHLLQQLGVRRILASGSVLQRNAALRHYTEKIFSHPLEVCPRTDAPVGAALAVNSIT